jgi:hypothetical protein
MKRTDLALAAGALVMGLLAPPPLHAAAVGQAAPDFTLTDTNGKRHTLSQYKGKIVVLEWVNFECPFVGKHYQSGHMQQLQKTYTGRGVAWLSVNSSAPGKQGHYDAERVNALVKEKAASPTAYLLDTDGTVGRAYGAKTTPHMFVIDAKGTLLYAGGIDDTPSTDLADIATARNYVSAALDEVLAGQPVKVTSSQPYGCSVKYGARAGE